MILLNYHIFSSTHFRLCIVIGLMFYKRMVGVLMICLYFFALKQRETFELSLFIGY